jgi:hypothetical protein
MGGRMTVLYKQVDLFFIVISWSGWIVLVLLPLQLSVCCDSDRKERVE